ncbi:MAG: N-alpha-acetyl-L-2,4-diaminobutyrate deacetylase [uncultured Paraburkholderia sp.]|nr:MAG: N-alpha-acetyl-L-2,4-diaminobutyrate deacetylase [uncultured Paraburkholderia sp.]
MDYLARDVIEVRGWGALKIGVEMDNYYFSASAYRSLVEHLPKATWHDATSLVNWQRAVKSPREIEYMRVAARIVERIEPGMRKNDLVADIYSTGIRGVQGHGGDYPAIVPLLPTGTDAAAPHLTWDDTPFVKGAGTFFEIAGCFRRYHCPQSRTVFLGKPPKHFIDGERAVVEGIEARLAAAKPGNTCEDIAHVFFAILHKYGIEKNSRCGYPIGASYPPDWGERTMSLRPGDKTVLEPGMTFHFMPGLWLDDWGLDYRKHPDHGERRRDLLQHPAQAVREGVVHMRASPIQPTVDFHTDGEQHGFLKLPHSHDASAWGAVMIPVTVIRNGDGPTALLTGGNHGDEYEGPIALSKLASTLKAEDVKGRVIVVPFMNYPAFRAGSRTSPIDRGNLNRSFPGRPDGTVTEKIADYFQRHLLPLADYVLDLHAGGRTLDFVPFAAIHLLSDERQQARCEAAMRAFGAPYSMRMLELDSVGLFDTAAEEAGKVFVSTELGGGGTATAASVAVAARGVRGFLQHAGILAAEPNRHGANCAHHDSARYARR